VFLILLGAEIHPEGHQTVQSKGWRHGQAGQEGHVTVTQDEEVLVLWHGRVNTVEQ
jgi:hypothetical protein